MAQSSRPNAHLSHLLKLLEQHHVTRYEDGALKIEFSPAAVAEKAVARALEKAGLQVEDGPIEAEPPPPEDLDPRFALERIHLANARRRGNDA